MNWYLEVLKKYTVFSGRARRKEYWMFFLFNVIILFVLGFVDAGNTWNTFGESDLFDLRKGIGLGVRIELPMLGVMGFDYAYGYDKIFGGSWVPHLNLGGTF